MQINMSTLSYEQDIAGEVCFNEDMAPKNVPNIDDYQEHMIHISEQKNYGIRPKAHNEMTLSIAKLEFNDDAMYNESFSELSSSNFMRTGSTQVSNIGGYKSMISPQHMRGYTQPVFSSVPNDDFSSFVNVHQSNEDFDEQMSDLAVDQHQTISVIATND